MDKPTRIDYDKIAAAYAQNRQLHPGVLAGLLTLCPADSAVDLLEVGCGTGNYIIALSGLLAGRCVGIDPSAEMLERAARRCDTVCFRQAEAERLPFPDASCDIVFSVDVIHHVQDRPAYFAEAFRVLRPAGKICTVTDSESVIRRRRPLSSHFPATVPLELARYPQIAQLRAEMAQVGFTDLHESEVEHSYLLTELQAYRQKAYSALHLITDAAFAAGLARLERDLEQGPIPCHSLYTLLWAQKHQAMDTLPRIQR